MKPKTQSQPKISIRVWLSHLRLSSPMEPETQFATKNFNPCSSVLKINPKQTDPIQVQPVGLSRKLNSPIDESAFI